MHSPGTSNGTTGPWNISDAGPKFGSMKLPTAIIRAALMLAMISALLLIAALPAQAQEAVLYNFTGGSDGANPQSNLTFDSAGNLYGTTPGGGLGYGVVFEISPNGGWHETVLYSFTGGADGSSPSGPVIFDNLGNLYGTTDSGGAYGYGVVFELSPTGASWTETVLCTFTGGYNANPINGLIFDPAGNLYGTASGGAVFELSPSGGGWTEQIIYTVMGPVGLTMDAAGNIFGVSYYNVFKLSPNGNGGWNPTVIHTFAGPPKDGSNPQGAPVLDEAGNIYGTTSGGGAKNYGTVYMLSLITTGKKKGQWKERILHPFADNSGGSLPRAGILFNGPGTICLTTWSSGYRGAGTIYQLSGYRFRYKGAVWRFHYADGAHPQGSLIRDSAGNLYGTTSSGGSSNAGVVFVFTP